MEFKVVECDFITRTLKIIEQYDTFVMPSTPEGEQLEVSLLINCLTGLLVLPFEHQKRVQNSDIPNICSDGNTPIKGLGEEWGLTQMKIKKFILKGQPIRQEDTILSQTVAMMRHSIAHSMFGDGNDTKRKPNGVSVGYHELQNNNPYAPEKLKSKIKEVNFKNNYRNTEFEASIPVTDLKIFAKKLANSVLAEMACFKQ